MIQTIHKLGRSGIVLLITGISVSTSLFITSMVFYVWQGSAISNIGLAAAILTPLTVTPVVSWYLLGLLMKVSTLEQEMRLLASLDPLTELLNRRAFFNDAKVLVNYAIREQISVSIVALDLDKFKSINDTYGHSTGDLALTNFTKVLKSCCRQSDVTGRLGGEEFAVFLPNTSADEAYLFTQRLHLALGHSPIKVQNTLIKYTVSIGLLSLVPTKMDTIESLLHKVDSSLYIAKNSGRNRTIVHGS
ncbi:GGDEF domain-containing protein [Shewanella sp. 1CM18E]|uniref:GGDEF domain-containing protein n=1 Tax=Shewanella sp. 1CM18E TaxID=2929169 RepID=UPI0020C07B3A|nr:GGDEF domain-containing protein [Shewanella sp. 1CM18E]MCK8044117.1 GGDEF domain-containing protein [Shewanella sp. 1CM18E]